ncbi:Bug family tripartite tricarboxylate transporter substrate binding protein [Crenalkalicoccus roseus]|uniref:Bug family tripartite tricarboxylate transporter substrate binding protein n=1 Tax=Crenalkalicoccus roseus TaxID=1485588 RepID=UPI0010803F56|nr:tripartite tricarboxylate transporter substrate binding protein [Crenalkalicoccus roseus]
MMRRRALLALASAMALPGTALAQNVWPSRPITIMGGFPNGSGVDIYARKLAEPLSRALGVPVVVDNRTGAGGNIASDHVAKARPDGYLFLFGTAGTHAINASLYRTLPFDPFQDVTHVALLGDVPNVLTVNPEKRPQYRTCQDLIAAARARPGALNYASTGNGASTHLAGAQFAAAANIEITHIPYRGQPGAMGALLAGDVDLFFNQTGPAIAAIRQGQVRGLAVTTRDRVPALPEIPTVEEACGLPGFESSTWYALFAPPGLPEPIQRRMNAEVNRIIAEPEFRRWLIETQGITPPAATTPEAFREIHRRDIERWREVVRRSGATVD